MKTEPKKEVSSARLVVAWTVVNVILVPIGGGALTFTVCKSAGLLVALCVGLGSMLVAEWVACWFGLGWDALE
jgi:hypothetical protein